MRVIVLRPGHTEPEEKPRRAELAPDGAPVSNIRIAQLLWPLIRVVLVSNPTRRMLIEARAFDPLLHRVDTSPTVKLVPERRREMPDLSTEPEAVLLTWTMPKLRTLPEALFVSRPADDKSEFVKQILQVRALARQTK